MTTLVTTENSIYEFDAPTQRVRRLAGVGEPTPNMQRVVTPGGDWMPYTTLQRHPRYPDSILITWGLEGNVLRRTLTSKVHAIDGDPLEFDSWGDSNEEDIDA